MKIQQACSIDLWKEVTYEDFPHAGSIWVGTGGAFSDLIYT
jgi:hypothetical protein